MVGVTQVSKQIAIETKAGLASIAKLLLDDNLQINLARNLVDEALYREALRRTKGNRTKAARLLGLHRSTFLRGVQRGTALI